MFFQFEKMNTPSIGPIVCLSFFVASPFDQPTTSAIDFTQRWCFGSTGQIWVQSPTALIFVGDLNPCGLYFSHNIGQIIHVYMMYMIHIYIYIQIHIHIYIYSMMFYILQYSIYVYILY